MTVPEVTLSPTLTVSATSFPATVLGTSMDALALSNTMSDWSSAMVSPGLTHSSMMSTVSLLPKSGMCTSAIATVEPLFGLYPISCITDWFFQDQC